ncbi:MAG: prephenate dehydrogenase [Lachnospiraceae bacterium]|nr:prephenate dehydrogenase [Lachnospiraceae bacterium]
MEWINRKNILIVGLGLIGGSYGMALKRLGYRVLAIDTDKDTIDYAMENGIIDSGSTEVSEEMLGEADAVIFALYPHVFVEWIKNYQQYFKSGIRITDVTGVKTAVVYEIQDILRDDIEFIASHPMAGKETSGVRYSDDRIFRDANFIVVPTERNTPEAVEWCYNMGRILGFRHISVLSPEEHDKMIGYVSQLTHCIAVSLMTCNDDENLVHYTGDSFRDLTRIARINEVMWSELFLDNKEELSGHIERFIEELKGIRDALDRGDAEYLKSKMRLSTERRAKFDKVRK